MGIAVSGDRAIGGRRLFLNMVTRPAKKASQSGLDEGFLQVELIDATGKPIPGFSRDDCPTLRCDHASLRVAWKGGDVAPAACARPGSTSSEPSSMVSSSVLPMLRSGSRLSALRQNRWV